MDVRAIGMQKLTLSRITSKSKIFLASNSGIMKIVEKEGKQYVFDIIRRRYLRLTPEEEVRQQIVHWMIDKLKYPKSSISLEKAVNLHGTKRRYDIVIYSASLPWMIVECKAPSVKISQETFDQVANYNRALNVPFLYMTNAEQHYIVQIDPETKTYEFLKEMPGYPG